MKCKKVEDVRYNVLQHSGEPQVSLVWKEGEVFIAMSNLLLKDGEAWYEIPVKDLEKIDVVSESPLQIRFSLPCIDVTLSGERANRLLALRHFLLPHIDGEKRRNHLLESALKFWCVGISNVEALSIILEIQPAEVQSLLNEAHARGLLTSDGRLTMAGLEMFPEEDREMLVKGGRCE